MTHTALVTGANRGIGLAIAHGLVDCGLGVVVGARSAEDGAEAAKQIGARAVPLDVSDHESIASAVAEIGEIDVLVNNAGVLGSGGVLDDPAEFERSMRVMVDGPFYLMHLTLPHMRQRGYGRIVNVSSGWGAFSDGVAGPGGYGVAKASLNALTLAASRGVSGDIKINAMCPGWVRTRMGGDAASRSPREGADTAIWLATLPRSGPNGGFFRDRKRINW